MALAIPAFVTDNALDLLSITVAAVGALLIFYQVRAAKAQLTLMNYTEYTRRYYEIVQRLPADIYAKDFMLEGHPEHESILRQMRSYFDLSFEEWDLHSRGLIDRAAWALWNTGISTAVDRPAFRQAWATIKHSGTYSAGFEDYVAASMRRVD